MGKGIKSKSKRIEETENMKIRKKEYCLLEYILKNKKVTLEQLQQEKQFSAYDFLNFPHHLIGRFLYVEKEIRDEDGCAIAWSENTCFSCNRNGTILIETRRKYRHIWYASMLFSAFMSIIILLLILYKQNII